MRYVTPFKRAAVCATALALTGCAAIMPRAVSLDINHVSHVSQHFGAHPTDFGYDSVTVGARWRKNRWHGTLSEGLVIESQDPRVQDKCHGGLFGPREVFQASVGVDLWRKQ